MRIKQSSPKIIYYFVSNTLVIPKIFRNFAAENNRLKRNMIRKYKNKEEMIAAFKHALGARDAFEDLVQGKIDRMEFENRGYKLMQIG